MPFNAPAALPRSTNPRKKNTGASMQNFLDLLLGKNNPRMGFTPGDSSAPSTQNPINVTGGAGSNYGPNYPQPVGTPSPVGQMSANPEVMTRYGIQQPRNYETTPGGMSAPVNTPGGGGGGNGIVPQTPGAPNDDGLGSSERYTGFAGSFDPEMLNEIYASPDALVFEYLKYLGNKHPSNAVMDRFSPLAEAGPLMELLLNPTMDYNDTSNDTTADSLNWLKNLLDQGSTPGGRVASGDTMLQNLVTAGKMSSNGAENTGNSLYEVLNGGDDASQISQYMDYAQAAIRSLNPRGQEAVMNRLERWGREWASARRTNMDDPTTFGQFVAQRGGIFGVD